LSTPIEQFETSMYDALLSINQGQWHVALKALDEVEKSCRRFGFTQALPAILLNQSIVHEALNREPQLNRTWECFLAQIEETPISATAIAGGGETLKRFARMMGTSPALETLTASIEEVGLPEPSVVSRATAGQFSTDSFVQMHPAVIGLTLGLVHTFSDAGASEREWLDPLTGQFGQQEEPDTYLELIALMASDPVDTVRVYRTLCKLLEHPSDSSIVIVFLAWLAALKLEGDGLPHKLAFSPNPPQEQRLLFTVRLLGRLGTCLGDRAGYEGFIETIWYALMDAADELTQRIELRHEKGGKKGADVETQAEIVFWYASADVYFGEFERALARLRPMAEIASRQALNAPHIAIRILRLRACILEQAQRPSDALDGYLRAITLIVPKFDPVHYLSNFFNAVGALDGDSPTALELMSAFAGWLRLSDVTETQRRKIGYDLIELLDEVMDCNAHAEGSAYICLALAYHGDVGAARSGYVWSQRCGLPAVMMSAWVYRVLLDTSVFDESQKDAFNHALDLLECLPITPFRLTVQLLIAEGVLRSGVRGLRPTAEMLIRRAALTLSSDSYRGCGELALLRLPSDWLTSLSDTIDAAVEVELSASLRPLLNVYSQYDASRRPPVPLDTRAGDELSALVGQIMARFSASGGIAEDLVERILPMVPALYAVSSNRLPRLERPRGREAFLESYDIQGRWVVLLVSANGGGVLIPAEARPNVPLLYALAELVGTYVSEGERLYVSERLPIEAVGFEALLQDRQTLEIIYGPRIKGAALKWSTPPTIMMVGDGWTSQHLNFLHSGLKDDADIRMCHEFEEQAGIGRGEWDSVDVAMFGVSLNTQGALTLWENGQLMNAEQIGFARGDTQQGLAVLVSSKRTVCHDIALELTDYFGAGVIVASDTQTGYGAICEVVNRTGLLSDPVEVARYIKRGLNHSTLKSTDFCVLYVGGSE
jgi:hypothetical protein